MRFRIRTIMLAILGLALPLYLGCEAWKVGGLMPVLVVWSLFVGIPLVFLVLLPGNFVEGAKENAIAMFLSLAIVGSFVALFFTLLIIGVSSLDFHR